AISGPSEVADVDVMFENSADRGGADDVSVAVVMGAAVVEASREAPLGGVTFPEEVLPIEIGDDHLLITPVECVQVGVGVLLAHIEPDEVVLKAIIGPISENTHAEVHIVEKEAAKIGVERL